MTVLHPIFVHVPLALPLLLFFIETFFLIQKKRLLDPALKFNLMFFLNVLLILTASAAIVTGKLDMHYSSASTELLESHENFGYVFVILCLAGTALSFFHSRMKESRLAQWLVLLFYFLLSLASIPLGHLGGKLVY